LHALESLIARHGVLDSRHSFDEVFLLLIHLQSLVVMLFGIEEILLLLLEGRRIVGNRFIHQT
jgi:hypothetical protein